ncbi:hypothetical protein PSENEW3_00004060 [Picochlorum sp. SENEW3]|nr:hypothetical protein PSENEW3_00004060 [Picochlorum sp. SENEW3]
MKKSVGMKACLLMVLLSAFAVDVTLAKKGRGKGKGPKDDKGDRPEGGQGKRPAGAGNRPSRGPPGLGIFADTGADTTPALLSTLPKARDGSLGLAANGQIMIVFQNRTGPKNETSGPQLFVSFSETGESWSTSEPVVIQGLPAGVSFVTSPTLTSSGAGTLMYFTGASDKNLRETPSAIHVAIHNGGGVFTYAGEAFSVPGAIMGKNAVAFSGTTGYMIVPQHGVMRDDDDDDDDDQAEALPIVARKLLDRKKGGKKGGKRGSNMAYLATGTGPASFGPAYTNITLPQEDRRNSWVGTLLSSGNQLVFYGSGPGPWPVVSSDAGATWTVADTQVNYPSQDPSVLPVSGRTLIAAGVKKSRGPKPAPAPMAA